MAALQCEICGGKLIGKPGGVFECDSCGMEYSTEWAKAKVQEIKGTVKIEGPVEVTGTVKVEGGANVESLLKRGNIALEDEDWDKAQELFEQVLSIEPENGEAYLGLAMADEETPTRKDFAAAYIAKEIAIDDKNLPRARQFGGSELKEWLDDLKQKKAEAQQKQEEERRRRIPVLTERRRQLVPASGLIDASRDYIVGLQPDGTVVTAGDNSDDWRDVSGWRDIAAVACGSGDYHVVGVKKDGTVVATGKDSYGVSKVRDWQDIVAVSVGEHYVVGLKADGTVVAEGYVDTSEGWGDLSGWQDIVAVAAGARFFAGLKADGTVLITKRHSPVFSVVRNWRNIVAVACGDAHIVGLKSDGTVVAAGQQVLFDECLKVQDWRNIVAIACGDSHTVGLKADGTVVDAGRHKGDAGGWTDIVAVACGGFRTVGLKSDGTVETVSSYDRDLCDAGGWKLFNSVDTLEQERAEAKARQEAEAEAERRRQEAEAEAERQRQEDARQQKIAALEAQKQSLQTEIANCKGLFSGGKRRELEARLAQIEKELSTL